MSAGSLAIVRPDYVAFTVSNDTPVEAVKQFLGVKFRELGWGRYRYRSGAIAEVGGFEVYWDGSQEGMGTHVRISGQGCRILEEDPFFEWTDFYQEVRDRLKARFTRVDVAIDDEGFTVPFSTVLEAVKGDHISGRFDREKGVKHIQQGFGPKACQTLYIGSRESSAMLRIYTKGFELGGDTPWLRFEAEFKKERAEAWVTILLEKGWDAAIGALRSCWEFKDPDHVTSDRTRQRAAPWWASLIGRAKHAFKLGQVAEVAWSKVQTWMVKQWAPTVAMVMNVTGGDLSAFVELCGIGERRWSEKHRRLMALAQGMPSLSFAR